MNITLVISSLTGGGAERVMSIMANYWVEKGNSITLITLDSEENDFYQLDPRVRRVGLALTQNSTSVFSAFKNNFARVLRLRAAIRASHPKVVICFQDRTNVLALVATWGLTIPIVVSERSNPFYHNVDRKWDSLRRWLYPRAKAVVVQTVEMKEWVAEFVASDRVHIIPNPVMPVEEKNNLILPIEITPPYIVAMGRLVPLKGFDLLLKAFARCRHKNWSLVILGEGPERENLEYQVRQLELDSCVYLPGRVIEPVAVLKQAALFVLSSQYEGFPNALIEAMSCGLPVISFDCPYGPSFIIRDNVNGILVPPDNVEALTYAMDNLMSDKCRRQRLGYQARGIVEKFSIDKIMGQWEKLLNDLSNC